MMLETVDILVDIDKDDIKIHIGGGVWTDLASMFESLFKKTIADTIRDEVKSVLSTTIPQMANASIIANDGFANIVPFWWWDWESPEAAKITNETFQFSTKGLMFDNRTGEVDPGVVPPQMPAKVAENPAKLQGYISTYAIQSFATTTSSVFSESIWFNSSLVDDKGLFPTNTSTVEELLPGISKYYGPDAPVNVKISILSIQNISVSGDDQKMGAKFTAQLEFWVVVKDKGPEQAAAITLKDTDFDFTALIQNMTLGM
jgi:hypothetical protein